LPEFSFFPDRWRMVSAKSEGLGRLAARSLFPNRIQYMPVERQFRPQKMVFSRFRQILDADCFQMRHAIPCPETMKIFGRVLP